jgi:hypothetical protein
MRFQILALILMLFSQLSFSQGRKPAVEDFVGIEVEHPEAAPQGTENLFNFEKDMNQFQKTGNQATSTSVESPSAGSPSDPMRYLGIFTLLALPAVISFLVMNNMKKKAKEESQSNIKVLEEFRRQKQELKKSEDDIKKAS